MMLRSSRLVIVTMPHLGVSEVSLRYEFFPLPARKGARGMVERVVHHPASARTARPDDFPPCRRWRSAISKRDRQNILTDQQQAGMMSCAEDGYLRTPAMDSLAAGGVRFERAYCANPVCLPSRYAMMTGHMVVGTSTCYTTRAGAASSSSTSTPTQARWAIP